MDYIFDTNILIAYIRASEVCQRIDETYSPFGEENTAIISAVSVGEIKSIAIRNNWGKKKLYTLEELLKAFLVASININSIIERYAEIDAYSQGKLKGKSHGKTARNMGKNDLWIAATSSILKAKLLTTDQDFSHLIDSDFLEIDIIRI